MGKKLAAIGLAAGLTVGAAAGARTVRLVSCSRAMVIMRLSFVTSWTRRRYRPAPNRASREPVIRCLPIAGLAG